MNDNVTRMDSALCTGLTVPLPSFAGPSLRRRWLSSFLDLDLNGDGVITDADFEIMAQKLHKKGAQVHGDTIQRVDSLPTVRKHLLGFWEALRKSADTNNSGRINRDEWVVYRAKELSGLKSYADFNPLLLNASDEYWNKMTNNSTKPADENSYVQFAMEVRGHWLPDKNVYSEHFKKITGGKDTLPRQEFENIVFNWLTNENAPQTLWWWPDPKCPVSVSS